MELNQLPEFIVTHIFSYLSDSPTLLCTCSRVCKKWLTHIRNPLLWRWLLFKMPKGRSGDCLYGKGSGSNIEFRKLFITKSLGVSWSRPCSTSTLHGHTGTILTIDYNGKYAVTGGADNLIKIWDIPGGTCTKTFQQHTEPVRCVQFDSSKILSAADDRTLRYWRLDTGAIGILQQFSASLRSMHFENNTVVCSGVNPIINVIDIPSGKPKALLKGHTSVVYSLNLSGSLVASGGGDNLVKLWDLRTGNCVSDFTFHKDKVRCVKLAGHLLASGSDDLTAKLLDTRKIAAGVQASILENFEYSSQVTDMCYDGLRLVVSSKNNLSTFVDGTPVRHLPVPNVMCLKFSSKTPTIVAGLVDHSITVYEFSSRGRKRKVK